MGKEQMKHYKQNKKDTINKGIIISFLLVLAISQSRTLAETALGQERFISQTAAKYAKGRLIVKYKDGVNVVNLQQSTQMRSFHNRHGLKRMQHVMRELDNPGSKVHDRASFIEHMKRIGKKNTLNQNTGDLSEVPNLHDIYTLDFTDQTADMEALSQEYANDPNVEYASPDYFLEVSVVPNDPQYASQWAYPKMSAPAGWDIEKGKAAVVVAVIDTGVDWNHPDLAANIWSNTDEIAGNGIDDDNNGYVDDVRGWDFVDVTQASSFATGEDIGPPDNDPMDFYGHGTLIAGAIAAVTNNSIGVSGTAWNCKIMPLRVGAAERVDSGTTPLDGGVYILSSWMADAVTYAANNGANVINLSINDANWPGVVKDAIDFAYTKDCVIVSSAGNHGEVFPQYPAAYAKVIGVAATNQSDQRAIWGVPQPPLNEGNESNYGTWVKVAAPGTAVLTTAFNDTYQTTSGTSISCAFVSGLAALIRSHYPSMTNAEVMKVISSTTDPITSDKYIGTGRINIARALGMSAVPVAQITAPVNEQTIATNPTITGSAGGTNFSYYTLKYGSRYYPTSWTTITTSTTPVTNGTLGTWDISYLTDNTFYTLRLSVTDSAGNTSVSEIIAYVQKNVASGWPKVMSGALGGEGVSIGDIDKDGYQEIAAVYRRSLGGPNWTYDLNVLRSDGSTVLGWPVSSINHYISGSPTFADLTGNGELETIISGYDWSYPNSTTKFHVFDRSGSYLPGWPQTYVDTHGYTCSTPAVADIDKDGSKEIVFTTQRDGGTPPGAIVFVYHKDGTVAAGWPKIFDLLFPANTGTVQDQASHPCIIDMNNDGYPEIIVGMGFYNAARVYAFHYDGSTVTGWPVTLPDGYTPKVVAADIDNDGNVEIVGTTESGRMYVWKADGTVYPGWPISPLTCFSAPVLADLDGDKKLEIIVHDMSDQEYAYRYNGTLVSGWPVATTQHSGGTQWPPAVVGDIDGDNAQEVVQAAGDEAYIYAWHANGTVVSGWPKVIPQASGLSPALGDMDNDGSLEMVVAYNDTLNLWKMPAPFSPGALQWPMAWFNKEHTAAVATLYGDINGDKEITAFDAALTARAAVGLDILTPSQAKAADVSGDADITAFDAALIAQYAVGLIKKFPVE